MTKTSNKAPRLMGLSTAEAQRSREMHGANVLKKRKTKSFITRFFENLGDPVIRILLVALAVDLVFVFNGGNVAETIGIGISVFLAAFISALSESGGENAFKKLACESGRQDYRVRRDNRIVTLPTSEIVVGDIVIVSAGEKVPADAFVRTGKLCVDQSSITGESKEIKKYPDKTDSPAPDSAGTVLGGCSILSGDAQIEIFAVGDSSMLGRISAEVQTDPRESPLKIRLTKLARQISRLGYLAAALIAIAYLFNCFFIDSGFEWALVYQRVRDIPYLLSHLLHAFMLGLTVIVVAVPEGLPMMIAVVLSSNIRKMARDNVLVRKPVGIEAAGSMNILFTDKTGTLTEGKMSVDSLILADGSEHTCAFLAHHSKNVFELYLHSCFENTLAALSSGKAMGGNATERALLESVAEFADNRISGAIAKLPFDSSIKYSAAKVSFGKKDIVLIKGAPEKLIPRIDKCYLADGSIAPFSSYKSSLLSLIDQRCSEGKRLLIIAACETMPTPKQIPPLTLVCAVSLGDKLRTQAKRSVSELLGAGIGVVMITGDSKPTATAIARQCGIINSHRNIVLDSAELEKLSDTQLKELLGRLAVVCRALPSDKSRLVRAAQELELVVGMTGDGINDAPALKYADIGFAMGSGTDVAKDAGDIIIIDNDLASIVKAVLYGRNIFKSIRKFITLQLTMNFSAVGVSMIGPFVGIDAPVTVVQMLWINIIIDTLGGLAFAGEAPSLLSMKEKPKRRDEPILNGYMINQILLLGSFTIGLCLFFLLSPEVSLHFRESPDKIYLLTAFFALFIFTSVINCFSSRCDRLSYLSGITKNPTFIAIMSVICIVQIAFVYLGGSVLRTLPLTLSELFYTLSLSLFVIPAELVRRTLWRLCGKKSGF